MLLSYDLFALAASACWACSSLLSVPPSRHLGAIAYTRWRMLMVALMLWFAALIIDPWLSISWSNFGLMALSGLIGIFIGDTAYFSASNRLGPRRAGVLFATNAFFSAFLGFFVFDERMGARTLLGAFLTLTGVMIAIFWGQRKAEDHAWEINFGHPLTGGLLGLLSALCQSVGVLVAKPVIVGGMAPLTASAIRVSVACAALFVLLWLGLPSARHAQEPTRTVMWQTAFSGFVGMALGMTFLMLALRLGDLGQVAILSSVAPILTLPLLWFFLKRPPAKAAWIGALLTVVGTCLIVVR